MRLTDNSSFSDGRIPVIDTDHGAGYTYITQRVMNFFSARPAVPVEIFPDITESERNVLRLMAQGTSNEAIAQQLSLSSKTVRNYVSNIFGKLQVADRAQAIVKARDSGLT